MAGSGRVFDFITQFALGDLLQRYIQMIHAMTAIDGNHRVGAARKLFRAFRGENNEDHAIRHFLGRQSEIFVVQLKRSG